MSNGVRLSLSRRLKKRGKKMKNIMLLKPNSVVSMYFVLLFLQGYAEQYSTYSKRMFR